MSRLRRASRCSLTAFRSRPEFLKFLAAQRTPSPGRIVAESHRERERREQVRSHALKIHPWICARCGRDFSNGKKLHGLTVHHRDHNHDNNPPDGGNWELLCLYCPRERALRGERSQEAYDPEAPEAEAPHSSVPAVRRSRGPPEGQEIAVGPDDYRRIALGMADAVEREHMGHPDFRAPGPNGAAFSPRFTTVIESGGLAAHAGDAAAAIACVRRRTPFIRLPAPGDEAAPPPSGSRPSTRRRSARR